jgi:hypothetical protein
MRSSLVVGALLLASASALGQVPLSASPKLAAYVGETCKFSYNDRTEVADQFVAKDGNVVVHHMERVHLRRGRDQDMGNIQLAHASATTYSFTTSKGTRFVITPQATSSTLLVERFFYSRGHDKPVRYTCASG